MKEQKIHSFLRRRYLLAIFASTLDLVCILLLLEISGVFLCAFLFTLDPILASLRGFFQFLILALQIPIFLVLKNRAKNYFPKNYSHFVFRWENENFPWTENRASALLFSKKRHSPIEELFHQNLVVELSTAFGNTSVWTLLPLKPLLVTLVLGIGWNLFFSPADFQKSKLYLSINTLVNPSRSKLSFEFPDLKESYLRGIPFQISGLVHGEPIFPVFLDILSLSGTRLKELPVRELREIAPARFQFTIPMEGLQEEVKIRISSGTQSSELKTLSLVELPRILSQNITIIPPEYTSAPERTLREVPRTILEGSQAIQILKFNKNLASFSPQPQDLPIVLKQIGTDSVKITLSPTGALSYRLNFTGIHGYQGQSQTYSWKTYPDRPPTIEISTPASRYKTAAGALDQILLEVRAEDDLEVRKMRMDLISKQRFEMTYLSDSLSMNLDLSPSKRIFFRSLMELPSSYYLQEGDTLTLNVLAWDSLPSRGPIRSATHIIYIPYFFQEQEQAEAQTEEVIEDMEELIEEEEHSEKALQRMAEAAKKDPQLHKAPAMRESMEELLRRKQEIQKKSTELEKKLDEIIERDRAQNLLNEADLMKMSQIQNLYQDVMREMQMELSGLEQMARQNADLTPQKLSNMLQSFDKDKFSKELDRALQSLKKIKARRNLRKNLEKLAHLTKEHEKLSEALQNQSPVDESAAKRLQSEFDQIRKELEELSKNESLDQKLREGIKDQLTDQGKEIDSSYEKLSEGLKEQNSEKSQKSNQKIQQEMMKMRQNLESMVQESQQEVLRVNLERLDLFLRETLEQAIFLERVYVQVARLRGLQRKRFAARQLSFLDSSSRWLKEQISKEYESNLNFQKTIIQVMNMLESRVLLAVDFFESDRSRSNREPIRDVSRVNNQLTLILLHLKEELQKQQQQGEMSQFFESLEQLAQQQSQIQKGTQSASMHSPMQQQKMLEQLAFQQQLVRKSTERLYEQYQERMELARGLQGVSKEMKEVEKKLGAGESSKELQNKQKEIEYKLLESQNALKEQKEGKERKAKTAKKQSTQQGVIEDPQQERNRKLKMEILEQGRFPEVFHSLVNQYFQVIEEDRPTRR